MQEEVENRTVNLAISTTKLTGRTTLRAFNAWKNHHAKVKAKKNAKAEEIPQGKQSIQELIGQNQGVSSIDIAKTDLKGFEKIAGKYGVDYAITVDKSIKPPKYMVFFKARDADALTAAMTEYSNLKYKTKTKPSVLKQLNKLKQMIQTVVPDKIRTRKQERER